MTDAADDDSPLLPERWPGFPAVTAAVEVPADDAAYRRWLRAHAHDGYVVDLWLWPTSNPRCSRFPVFHLASCKFMQPDWQPEWTERHVGDGRAKLCSTSGRALANCVAACGEMLLFCLCDMHIG
jgi:hypothetical protein